METKVNGIEKYLISLNVIITNTPKISPIVIKIIPGIPKYLKGCLNAINSINDPTVTKYFIKKLENCVF